MGCISEILSLLWSGLGTFLEKYAGGLGTFLVGIAAMLGFCFRRKIFTDYLKMKKSDREQNAKSIIWKAIVPLKKRKSSIIDAVNYDNITEVEWKNFQYKVIEFSLDLSQDILDSVKKIESNLSKIFAAVRVYKSYPKNTEFNIEEVNELYREYENKLFLLERNLRKIE